jgi:hypothetical protein
MVQTDMFSPIVDLAENTATLSITSSSLIHIGPTAISAMALAGFVDLLGKRGQAAAEEMFETTTIPDPSSSEVSATASLHFFIRTLQTHTTASGKPVAQNVAFHVLVERVTCNEVAVGENEGGDETGKEEGWRLRKKEKSMGGPAVSTSLAFRTVTDEEAADLLPRHRRRAHVTAVRNARSWLTSEGASVEGKASAEATSLSGMITLEEREFGCTQVTIEASIIVRLTDRAAQYSSSKALESLSRALRGGGKGRGGGGDGGEEESCGSTASDSKASNPGSPSPYGAARMFVAATASALGTVRGGDNAAEEGSRASNPGSPSPYGAARMFVAATASALGTVRGGENAAEEGSNLSRSVSGFSGGERGLPKSILEHLSTASLADLHSRQARYAGVDSAQRRHFANADVLKAAPRLAAHETDFMNKSLGYDDPLNRGEWKKTLIKTGTSINSYEKTDKNANGITMTWNKIVANMDVPAADFLARCWLFMSYENVHKHRARHGNLLRKEISIPSSHSKITLSVQRIKTGLDNRVFAAMWCWRKEDDGSFTLAFGELDEYSHLHSDTAACSAVSEARGELKKSLDAAKAVTASSRGFWRVKPLAPNVCEATYVATFSLPSFVVAKYSRRMLEDTVAIQKKLARNGVVVDSEIRDVFPTPPTVKELLASGEPEVAEIIRNCEDLDFLHAGDEDWSRIPFDKHSNPLVEKWMKHTPPKRGERSIGVGKTKTTVDSSARNVCGWLQDYCSRERTMMSVESGEKARFIVERSSPHDIVAAVLKNMPFPLYCREFVVRVLCAFDEESQEFKIFSHPVDLVVDHGLKVRSVRGTSIMLLKIKPITDAQCDLTIVTRVEPGGAIPVSVVNSKMSKMLNTANDIRSLFQRDDEIDRNERGELVRVMRENEQVYSAEETAVEQGARAKFASISENRMEHVESPDDQTEMKKVFVPGQSSIVLIATAVIDASAEDCAAYQVMFMSREFRKKDFDMAGMNRALVKRNEHCSVIQAVYDFKVPGIRLREFVSLQIWRRLDDSSIAVVIDAVDLPGEFPTRPNVIRGNSSILWKMVPLPPVGGVARTHVTKFHHVDVKGALPKLLDNKRVIGGLMSVIDMRKLFDRSRDIDAASQALLVDNINSHTDRYSIEETNAVERELAKFDMFERNKSKKKKKLILPSPLKEAEIMLPDNDQHDGLWDDRRAYGVATAIVRARPVDVLSLCLDVTSSSNIEQDDVEKCVDEAPNGHSQLVYWRIKMPGNLLGDRDFVSRQIWKQTADGFVLVTHPEESAGREAVKGRRSTTNADRRSTRRKGRHIVRGQFPSALKISRVSDSETRIAYIIHPNWGRSGAMWLFDRFVAARLERVSKLQQHFLELRTMEHYDAVDGKALGTRLMYPGGDTSLKPWEKVGDIVRKHRGLVKLLREFPALVALLQEIVKGKLVMAGSVSTKLECLSEAEARKIGRSMAPALKSRKTAEAGLYQWKHQNASIVELCEKHPWVESMLLEMARIVLKTAPWGLAWRIGVGSSFSLLDLWSDVAVIVQYLFTPGREGFGLALLAMLCSCLSLQLLVVMGQNWKKKENLPREILIVVAGLKAPYDGWKVLRGKEQEEHHVTDARTELSFSRSIELFSEAIPGCVLQIYVALKFLAMGEQVSTRAIVSIVISALTTGYSSSIMTYDYDTDPEKRRLNPTFYGFIPDDGRSRSLLLVFMTLNSALLLLVRSFGTALLLQTSGPLFLLYTVGDMSVYLAQKMARGDFHYWVPFGEDSVFGLFVSLLGRFVVKVLVDYTGVLQFRAAVDLGGIYWSWSMFQAVIFSFAAAALYLREVDDAGEGGGAVASNSTTYSEGGSALQGDAVWWLVSSTTITWLLSFAGLLMLMKREYWQTFLSFETGSELVIAAFLKGRSEERKGDIFTNNKKMWLPIREDVKVWTLANWWKWKREKPAWLTEGLVGKIPDDMIPKEEDRKALEGARKSARLSIRGVLQGAAAGRGGGGSAGRRRKTAAVVRKGARVEAVN